MKHICKNREVFILGKIFAFLVDIIQTILLAAAIFLIVYVFLFRPFVVNGQSMFPNFHNGEYVLTSLIALKLDTPKRGDVIVFQAPKEGEKDFIKRVVGLPGDAVSLQSGSIYLNGQKFDESRYLKSDVQTYGGAFLREGQSVTVPTDNYFVVGDNRNYSSDSREWGFVSKDKLIGESFFVYWPVDRMRLIKNPLR